MIYTTLFTAALAISGTAVASPMNKHPWPPLPFSPHPNNPNNPNPNNPHVAFPPPPSAHPDPDAPTAHPDPSTDPGVAPSNKHKDGLAQWAKRHGKYWGVAVDQGILQKPGWATFIAREFNQVTPENSMKWTETEPHKDQFKFDAADYVVDFAGKNNMKIRGHALVWHKQLPSYVTDIKDRKVLTEAIQSHIAKVVGRWKGQIQVWDVVNEIFEQDGSLRDSVFSRVLGEDFVRIAFEAAHKADPEAKLYINDFNLDDPNAPKTKAMIEKVAKWRQEGYPISGIGSQSHIAPGGGHRHAAALKALSAVVPEVAVTELDIPNAPTEDYVAVVKGCLALENCVSLTSWGADDKVSWMPGKNALLFDANFKPKKAYEAIMSTP
ncbi:Endo-1,4-beta-xylanase 2 [Epichloe festucae Fl1]|uniref:Beta-xylanase n=1 Tax=Epichloe festucae (strain Fl1) TaxID=877507 RepID=A0A7S9KU18_EPIFF|nr:Endo-1,4-beta-xylanase 2 [Epichloe festucae Fl1]